MNKKYIILGVVFFVLLGIFTGTGAFCISLCFGIFFMYLVYKFLTKGITYKEKISVAQDFLKHKYGEKMGNYILKETLNERQKNKKHGGK